MNVWLAVESTIRHLAALERHSEHRNAIATPPAGVDLAGMSDMGGVKHFNVAVDTPNGDLELLKHVLAGANKQVDEGAEERKGGAGHLGKCFYSAGDEAVRCPSNEASHLVDARAAAMNVPGTWCQCQTFCPRQDLAAESLLSPCTCACSLSPCACACVLFAV